MNVSKVPSSLALLFFLLFAATAFGQSEKAGVTDVTTGMLAWIKRLNNDADKYFTPEKGEDLARNLEALRLDLTIYMKARKVLSDSLFRHNIAPGKKDPDNLESLKTKMNAVMERMRGVTDMVNNDLRAQGDKLNDDIYEVLYGQPGRYLSSLEAFLDGKDVTKKDLAVDGSAKYSRLEECITNLTAAQGKIERKLKR